MTEKDIIVLGGGFAGFWAALAARRMLGERGGVRLVSRDPILQIRPRLYEAHPESLGVDVRPMLGAAGIGFTEGEAVSLDLASRALDLARGAAVPYSRLVVAAGSVLRRPPIRGAETAYSVDTQSDAVAFDRRLATIAGGPAAPVIAVVGAGFTGIELALELRDRLAQHGARALAESARIILVDRAGVVGAELGSGPRPQIEAALAAASVELHLSAQIAALAPDRIAMADGMAIAADAVVLTTGMEAAPFTSRIPGQRDSLGRVLVDPFLRTPAAPDIYVAGDAAAADVGDGHIALQSCQHALQMGRCAGENAARSLLALPLRAYEQTRYVTCLDLGRSGAVLTHGWDRAVEKTGADAKALKRWINTVGISPPTHVSGDTLVALSSTNRDEQRAPELLTG